jgi:hypothetical protein
MINKKTKYTPAQVKAYEKISGSKTTGEVYAQATDKKVQQVLDALYVPKEKRR